MKLFCALLLIILMPTSLWANETITISTGEYTPFTSANLKHDGYVNHIIREAFKRVGYDVKYDYLPWKRAYELAKQGRYKASSYWSINSERVKHFHASEPVVVDKTVFYHLKSKSIDWNTLEDLKKYRIGATLEYSYSEEFWQAQKSKMLNIEVAPTDELNFKKLLRERIDIFPMGSITGYSLLSEKFDPSIVQLITFHPNALTSSPGHLMFSKADPNAEDLLKKFNEGLAQLTKEGMIDQFTDDLYAGRYKK